MSYMGVHPVRTMRRFPVPAADTQACPRMNAYVPLRTRLPMHPQACLTSWLLPRARRCSLRLLRSSGGREKGVGVRCGCDGKGRQAHAQSGRSATKHGARDRLHTAFVRVFGCGHGVMDELDALEALAGAGDGEDPSKSFISSVKTIDRSLHYDLHDNLLTHH